MQLHRHERVISGAILERNRDERNAECVLAVLNHLPPYSPEIRREKLFDRRNIFNYIKYINYVGAPTSLSGPAAVHGRRRERLTGPRTRALHPNRPGKRYIKCRDRRLNIK